MQRCVGAVLLAVMVVHLSVPAAAGVEPHAAMYIGGTVSEIPEKTAGHLDLADQEKLAFRWSGRSWELPYSQITSMEYGQKAGRRVGVAIAVSVWALFSKKRRHFLTIGFKDAQGKPQAALIEIGKARVKTSLAVLEARTGLRVEYETQEAREHVHG